MNITTIVFDAYGTLINTADGSVNATKEIIRKYNLDLNPTEVYARWKNHHIEIISSLSEFQLERNIFVEGLSRVYKDFNIVGCPDEDVKVMLATLGIRRLYPDALPCINKLKGRNKIAIASNTDSSPFIADLQNNNLSVDVWFTSESLQTYKPHEEFYLRMITELGCEPNDILFVGDSIDADVLGPINIGMRAVWLNRNGPSQTKLSELSEIASLDDLEQYL